MYELTEEEFNDLRSQFATSSHGGSRYLPFAFTEHGAVMLASVLNSETAIKMSIEVVRAFAKLRKLLMVHKDLALKIENLESKYDAQFKTAFNAIKQLMHEKSEEREPIGFKISKK
jgi:DNA repair protein RadC